MPLLKNRRPRHLLAVVAAVVTIISVLSASCSNGSGTSDPKSTETTVTTASPTKPRPGGSLAIAVPDSPILWSPASRTWSTSELQAGRAVYDRLMVRGETARPIPELAETVTSSPDFKVWTIRLRTGITFHDGSPLDAEAVAFNLEAQRQSPASSVTMLPVLTVTVADAKTVVVTMSSPWSTFAEVLTTQIGTIASPALLAGFSDGRPLGTGPFVYAGPALDGSTLFLRNPTYWKAGLPYLDSVTLVPIADAGLRADAVLEGRVQMVAVDEPRQLARLEKLTATNSTFTILDDRNSEKPKVSIALNTGKPPFDRITARRAVAFATDRTAILESVFENQGTISRGIVSDTSPWFSDHSSSARDLDRAKKQVEEYTKETGLPVAFRMLVPPDPTIARVASLWRVQLAAAGIEIELVPVETGSLTFDTLLGRYQAAITVGFDSLHPDSYLAQFDGLPAEQPVINRNITRYVDPTVTKAFTDARQSSDVLRQVDDYAIVQEQLSVDIPWLFLIQIREAIVISPKLRDVTQWMSASGSPGLGHDDATVSLAQIWIAP
ncbi:DdpA ABC-type dipeptide transport system, periplasmic component [Acidimicrobiia bacterium]